MLDTLAPETDDRADWARAAYERQIALLDALADTGVAIARQAAQVVGQTQCVALIEELAAAHARAARTVRLTLMLQTKVIRALQAHERGETVGVSTAAQRTKSRVKQIVGRIVMAQCDDTDHAEQLVEEAAERLDRDDVYGDVLSRPFSEIVDAIAADLGLTLDWAVLAEDDWAKAEIAGGVVGWPLADRRLKSLPPVDSQESPAFVSSAPPS